LIFFQILNQKKIQDLYGKFQDKNSLSIGQILEAIYVMVGMGLLTPSISATQASKILPKASLLNRILVNQNVGASRSSHLVSPLTLSGIHVLRIDQIFIEAYHKGLRNPDELSKYAQNVLGEQKEGLISEGEVVSDTQKLNKILHQNAIQFLNEIAPKLSRLMIEL
jgi:hypothetical protein